MAQARGLSHLAVGVRAVLASNERLHNPWQGAGRWEGGLKQS